MAPRTSRCRTPRHGCLRHPAAPAAQAPRPTGCGFRQSIAWVAHPCTPRGAPGRTDADTPLTPAPSHTPTRRLALAEYTTSACATACVRFFERLTHRLMADGRD